MQWRKACPLIVKPIGAAALVGVVVILLRIVIPREFLSWGPFDTALLLVWAPVCMSLFFQDACRPDAFVRHGAIGLAAGLMMGFIGCRPVSPGPWAKEVSVVDWRLIGMHSLITGLIGSLAGIVVGTVRCAVAGRFGRPAKWCDVEPTEKEFGAFPFALFTWRRLVQFAVFGAGLVVVFLLVVVDPPVIDSRGVAESLSIGAEAEAKSPAPIRSSSQVWQPSGVEALAFSSDSKYLATGGHDGVIRVWNTSDWTRAGDIKQEGRIARLAFSPDGQWLYVAGDDSRRGPLLCRFRWRTGEQDKVFSGHKQPVDGMALSADGRTLVSSSFMGDDLRLWDAISGVSVNGFVVESPAFAYASRRNFIVQWGRTGRGYTTAYQDGAQLPHIGFPGGLMAAAFGPEEQLLVAARRVHSASRDAAISLSVLESEGNQRTDRGIQYRPKAEVQFPGVWDDEAALVVSPGGKQVAVASGDVRLAVYRMPDLELIEEFLYPVSVARSQRIHQLAYSPDGRWLAAAQTGRPTPRLFDAATAKELILSKGNRLRDLRFSADGRTLRTLDADDTVCFWDATNLAFLRKVSIPAGYAVGSIRPSDGRYALCYDRLDLTRPVQVVDLENGTPICQASLPFAWNGPAEIGRWPHAGNIYWLGDSEVLCSERYLSYPPGTYEDWHRLNYRITNSSLKTKHISIPVRTVCKDLKLESGDLSHAGEVAEDGKHLFGISGGGKGAPPNVVGQFDLQTFRTAKLGTIDHPVNGPFGLVPGGKYFHLGLHIYDRRSLNLVAAKDFTGDFTTIAAVTFSPDGRHYAASLWQHNAENPPRPVVLVHETLTSRILAAFLPPTGVALMRFSRDGTQLALAYDDGTLEFRSVPSSQSARPVLP